MQSHKQMLGSFFFCIFFSYSSAILSILPCQVCYKLAFQSQTPRAKSPDQTFLWKFALKQLGRSQQNKQILYAEFLVSFLFTLEMWLSSPPGAASVISVEPHPHRWAELKPRLNTRGLLPLTAPFPLELSTEGTTLPMFLFLHFLSRPKYIG